MGFLIPENIPSRNDLPESLQQIAGSLRDLTADDVTVWLETSDEQVPALLVLDPTAGLVLLEAPSQMALGLRRSMASLKRTSTAPRLDAVRAGISERAELLEKLIEAESRLGVEFPTAATLALPLVSRRDFDRLKLEGDPETYLLKEDFRPDALRDALARVLGAAAERQLTEPEERIVRAALKPNIVIADPDDDDSADGRLVFRPRNCHEDDTIKVLDREQERLAHHLGEGYRVVRGVAGSGKTLVLVHRARFLAELFPQRRYLIACYNIPLSVALADQVAEYDNIEVRRIDQLSWDVARMQCKSPDDWTLQRERVAAIARNGSKWQKYDGVFVDEAQDLDPPAFDLAYAVLKKGREDFVVALDGAQNVYRKNARWNPPNMTARGRTTFLRSCYRNTKEIVEFAWRFLEQANIAHVSDDKLDDPTLIVPPEATSRRGPAPLVLQCGGVDSEADAISDRIMQAGKQGVPWNQIAVLYGTAKPWVFALQRRLERADIPAFWVSQNGKSKKQVIDAGNVVRIGTMQGLKGLEFSRVFICGVNNIYDAGADDEIQRRKVAYVAMTRAMDELVISVSGSGPIGQAIQAAAN